MVTVEVTDFSDPDAVRLRAAMAHEMDALYADFPPNYGGVQKARPEEFRDGRGIYVRARAGEETIGIGGLRVVADGTGEIKNVYVVPAWRNRGVAGRIMDALESWARSIGLGRLILETGDRQPEALALYARLGFDPIPAYPPWNPDLSICLGKSLEGPRKRDY